MSEADHASHDAQPREATQPSAAGETGAPAAAPEAAQASLTDQLVDRWFGDYAIPNYFGAAKAELKKRLNQLA